MRSFPQRQVLVYANAKSKEFTWYVLYTGFMRKSLFERLGSVPTFVEQSKFKPTLAPLETVAEWRRLQDINPTLSWTEYTLGHQYKWLILLSVESHRL